MMSQVKNAKLKVKGLWLMAILLVALTGCEQGDPFVDPGDTPDPQWTLTVENDMISSMTVLVKVSFAEQAGTLAAFIGDDCCGVTGPENYVEGLYWLYISPSTQGEEVQLKFYSPDMKRIFVSKEKFAYINNDRLGTVSAPYTPEWSIGK